jgi:hypothetical protein
MQIAFCFSNCALLFQTTAKPDVQDPVELQKTALCRQGRLLNAATILQQEDELLEESSQVAKKARQSTLLFVTPGNRMDE